MDINLIIRTSLSVLKDWRIIFIAFFSISFMMIGNYVVKYRKRPPKQKKAKPAPAPAAEEKKEADSEEE